MTNKDSQLVGQGVGKEIRFAVVMYGGVSLAIYINSIAQELLKMCRSTVEGIKEEKLKSTEIIYHRLSYLLSNREKLDEFAEKLNKAHALKDLNKIDEEISKVKTEIEDYCDKSENIPRTKFMVDVLTGTSAGGINAIFLAKALSNNQDIAQ